MTAAAGWCGPGFDIDGLLRWAAGSRASMSPGKRGGWGWWGPPPGTWGAEQWGHGRRGRGPGWPFEPPRARAGRGDIRLAILALLQEGPRHGYQLIGDIAERSAGAWKPSPGSIYPALSALQDEGLIDDEKIDGKRVFSLTAAGEEYVARRAEDLARVFAANAADQEHPEAADLRELIWGVGGAALSVLGSGTPEQRERAREILARTRRELYLLLAEDQAAGQEER